MDSYSPPPLKITAEEKKNAGFPARIWERNITFHSKSQECTLSSSTNKCKTLTLGKTLGPPTKKKKKKRRKHGTRQKNAPTRERRTDEVMISQPVVENGDERFPLRILLVRRGAALVGASHPGDSTRSSSGGFSVGVGFGFSRALRSTSLLRLARRRRNRLHWRSEVFLS